MDERIKILREHFGLTQEKFAQRLGVKRGAIANYEIGRNVPADSVVSLMCKVFNVREEWLRCGEGEMLSPVPASTLNQLAEECGLSHGETIIIQKFLELDPSLRRGIMSYIESVSFAFVSDAALVKEMKAELSRGDLHDMLDRQLDEEKEVTEKSEVS